MRKTKEQKAITLVALIITIIVLLILAVVAIGAVQNDGIMNHAKNAKQQYGEAQVTENSTIQSYLDKIQEHVGTGTGSETGGGNTEDKANKEPATTIAEAQADDMLTKTVNSDVTDKYGNKITIPAGFKILVDETTGYTAETIDVTKGIVITDGTNEFVWIPTPGDGKVYYSETKYKTITLGRYENFTANDDGEYVPAQTVANYATAITIKQYYTEETADNHNSSYGNSIAKDIGVFLTSAITKGGYYLGRYEAGNLNDTLVCKANQTVYGRVTQPQASSLSQNMYKDATTFISDLVNSYAWDTAIIFIQTFGGCEDYYNQNFSTTFANTGINLDKYCNINDMSGNAYEMTTGTSSYVDEGQHTSVVYRGGYCSSSPGAVTSRRAIFNTEVGRAELSFRPLLYVAL